MLGDLFKSDLFFGFTMMGFFYQSDDFLRFLVVAVVCVLFKCDFSLVSTA